MGGCQLAKGLSVESAPESEKGEMSDVGPDEHELRPPPCNCYSHNWPYFRQPVYPYDHSGDWELEDEWNRRLEQKTKSAGG